MALIVVDPGHGGTSAVGGSTPFGVRGRQGTLEKDVTLRLARRLVGRLGAEAILTRSSDVNLPLAQRAEVARREGAQVFLSLHANEGPPGARGPQAWVHPRASGSARRLAQRLHGALARLGGVSGGVHTGAMAVLAPELLGRADACLVEVDHLSDHAGEARLGNEADLDSIADALAAALRAHVEGGRYGRPKVTRVTAGEFSEELDSSMSLWISDPAELEIRAQLFRLSPSFVAMVKRLDAHTIAFSGKLPVPLGEDDIVHGRFMTGPHKGKWWLEIAAWMGQGHRFVPGTSPEASNINTISVEDHGGPNGPDRGGFILAMVHETLHFDSAVFARFPAKSTALLDKIDAFLDEEIWVRKRTLAIMKEITASRPAELNGFVVPTPPLVRREVERDFISGNDSLTYLETVVLEHLIHEAVAAEGISGAKLSELTQQAQKESVGSTDKLLQGTIGGFVLVYDPQKNLFVVPTTKTLELLMRRRATAARWAKLFEAGAGAAELEAAAQLHASVLFPPGISYTP